MRSIRLILLACLLISLAGAQGLDLPFKVLCIGAVLPGDSPIVDVLDPEPAVFYTLVPTRRASEMERDTARRYVRLYFPKTYELLGEYAFIIYAAAPDVRPLTAKQINQLQRATGEGIPAFADQGGISGYDAFEQAWVASGLHEMFPNDAAEVVAHGVEHSLGVNSFRISINTDPGLPPVLRPFIDLGVGNYAVSHGFYVVPKQGSTIWAEMDGIFPGRGKTFPWLMSIQYGEGLTWNMGDNFVSSFWANIYGEMRNPYRTDILSNVMFYSVGLELPEDVLLVHNQREAFGEYIMQRRFVIEVIEFAEAFGADVSKLHDGLEDGDRLRRDAEASYLEQDYDSSEAGMAEAFDLLRELNDGAISAKDGALMWVYLSEWLAVTATAIVVGLVTHSLLIRRRLYREQGRTQFF